MPTGDLLFLAEAKLSNFWQLIVDEKKQIFTSEKFLLLASEDGEFLPLRGLKAATESLSHWRVLSEDSSLDACCDQSALQKRGPKWSVQGLGCPGNACIPVGWGRLGKWGEVGDLWRQH